VRLDAAGRLPVGRETYTTSTSPEVIVVAVVEALAMPDWPTAIRDGAETTSPGSGDDDTVPGSDTGVTSVGSEHATPIEAMIAALTIGRSR